MSTKSTASLMDRVANDHPELPKKLTQKVLREFLETVVETLEGGARVRLTGLGILGRKNFAPRKARNPRTGETITVPATEKVTFKMSKTLRDRIKISRVSKKVSVKKKKVVARATAVDM